MPPWLSPRKPNRGWGAGLPRGACSPALPFTLQSSSQKSRLSNLVRASVGNSFTACIFVCFFSLESPLFSPLPSPQPPGCGCETIKL